MRGPRMRAALVLVTAMLLGVVCQAALVRPAAAQQARASVELKRVVGRVEILRAGQSQWVPAAVGARLVEGDDIRAFSGASADLAFPDTSTVVLVENSRLHMSKLEFDQQKLSRIVLLHLAVGKLRAAIAQTAITLARARQSNFAISTPTAVAAARGTVVWVFTDGQKSLMAVEPEPGIRIEPRIECITLAGTAGKRQMVVAGHETTDCAPPVLLSTQFQTLTNPATAGADLGAPVSAPSPVNILAIVSATGPTTEPVAGISTINQPPVGLPGPSSLGVNSEVFTPPPAPPACASPPCN
jgi:FecR-like protein